MGYFLPGLTEPQESELMHPLLKSVNWGERKIFSKSTQRERDRAERPEREGSSVRPQNPPSPHPVKLHQVLGCCERRKSRTNADVKKAEQERCEFSDAHKSVVPRSPQPSGAPSQTTLTPWPQRTAREWPQGSPQFLKWVIQSTRCS